MFVGHPILDEIKQGRRLRPTQTVDKSKPFIVAEGERVPAVKFAEAPNAPPPPPSNSSFYSAPPPPPTLRNRTPSNSSLLKLGGKGDRDALMKSIKSGTVRLRKTRTNDKSGLILSDEEMAAIRSRSSSNNLENVGSEISGSRDTLDSQGISYTQSSGEESSSEQRPQFRHSDSESDSAYGGYSSLSSYKSPPPAPPLPAHHQPASWNLGKFEQPQEPKPKPDYYFDENNLKVTKEDLESEIPAGSAQAKIAAFTRFQEQVGENGYPSRFARITPGKIQIREQFQQPSTNGYVHDSRANNYTPTAGSFMQRINGFPRQESEPPSSRYNGWSNGTGDSNGSSRDYGTTASSSSNNVGHARSSSGYEYQAPSMNYASNFSNGTLPRSNGTIRINPTTKKVSFSDTEHEPRSRSAVAMDRSSLPPLPRDPSPKKAPRDPSPQKYRRDPSPQKPIFSNDVSPQQRPASFVTDFRSSSPQKSPMSNQETRAVSPIKPASFLTEFRPTSPLRTPAFGIDYRETSTQKPRESSPTTYNHAPIMPKYSVPITIKTDMSAPPPPVPIVSPPALSPIKPPPSMLSPTKPNPLIQTNLVGASLNTSPQQTSPNVGFGPYKFTRKLSSDISQPNGNPNFVTNKAYHSMMSPVAKDDLSSASSFYSAQNSPTTYSTASEHQSRSNGPCSRLNSENLSPNSMNSFSSLSPSIRSASASPRNQNGVAPKPGENMSATLGRSFLKNGTAGEEHNAHFERLRKSFNTGSPRPVRRTVSSNDTDEITNGFKNEGPRSGEAIWKTAVMKKSSPEKAVPRVNGHSKDPVNVPINASWYQKEDYPEETNHVNGSSANKPQPQNGNTPGALHKLDIKPPMSLFDNMDPNSLRNNFMFAIDLSKDRPIEIVQR